MSQSRTIVLVHGIGGPRPEAEWLDPLNASLGYQRLPLLDADSDRVITIDYMDALRTGSRREPPARTWQAPEQAARLQGWADYLLRKDEMARTIDGARKRSANIPFAAVSDSFFTNWGADWLRHVRQYRSKEETRNAVWHAVLKQFPSSGHVIVMAHSLGSIVMLDLLARLPEPIRVDLLLTLGSPMGVGVLRRHHGGLDTVGGFPSPRVGCWVNVFNPDDLFTVGCGASRHFLAALDAPIDTGWDHDLRAYMSQPVVAAAVGLAAFGPRSEPTRDGAVARTVDPQWQSLLLRFAFTHELWSSWPKDEWNKRRRMDLARRLTAEEAIDQARERRESMLRQAANSPEALRDALLAYISGSPVGPDRMPSIDDLRIHAGEHTKNEYSDEQLVLAGVDLLLSPPFAPYDIEIPAKRKTEALAYLLHRIRRDASGVSGKDFAEAVAAAVKDAKSALADGDFPWTAVLVGSGVLILAATGIGLIAAAPAGLAGAAAISATLATFGPGGMAGGVATLAALSGTSMALTTAGITLEAKSGKQVAQLQQSIAQEVAGLPVPAFRTALSGVLAVTAARIQLELDENGAQTEQTLLLVQAEVLHRRSLHHEVAPGSRETAQWDKKADIVAKALDFLALKAKDSGIAVAARKAVVAAIEGSAASPALPGRRGVAALES